MMELFVAERHLPPYCIIEIVTDNLANTFLPKKLLFYLQVELASELQNYGLTLFYKENYHFTKKIVVYYEYCISWSCVFHVILLLTEI